MCCFEIRTVRRSLPILVLRASSTDESQTVVDVYTVVGCAYWMAPEMLKVISFLLYVGRSLPQLNTTYFAYTWHYCDSLNVKNWDSGFQLLRFLFKDWRYALAGDSVRPSSWPVFIRHNSVWVDRAVHRRSRCPRSNRRFWSLPWCISQSILPTMSEILSFNRISLLDSWPWLAGKSE